MTVDYRQYAGKLKIIPVHAKSTANTSGYLTNPGLYTGYTPFTETVQIIHATVGSNTLPYFADKVDAAWNITHQAGSITDGRLVCAHQLIPKDDYTIYDMVPAGYGCGHCNPGLIHGVGSLNYHARGYEVENLQNGLHGDPFAESQYIKLALTLAYHTAVAHVPNTMIGGHKDATLGALMMGYAASHTDPDSGPFDWCRLYGHLWEIRKPENWPGVQWGLPLWSGQ